MVDTGREHHWWRLSSKFSHLKQVPLRAIFGPKQNETSQTCKSSLGAKHNAAHLCIKNTFKRMLLLT